METTKLSSKGQVIIPKSLRAAHCWEAGMEFYAEDHGDGILLRPKKLFEKTNIEDVAGCLNYQGEPKTQEDTDNAIKRKLKDEWSRCS